MWAQYRKFWVALIGVAVLVLCNHFEIEIPGLSEVVRDMLIAALIAAGVYQLPNDTAAPVSDPMDDFTGGEV